MLGSAKNIFIADVHNFFFFFNLMRSTLLVKRYYHRHRFCACLMHAEIFAVRLFFISSIHILNVSIKKALSRLLLHRSYLKFYCEHMFYAMSTSQTDDDYVFLCVLWLSLPYFNINTLGAMRKVKNTTYNG